MNLPPFYWGETGKTLYALVFRDSDAKVWNTSGTPAFETFNVSHYGNYVVGATETPSGSYLYVVTWPAGIATRGDYTVRFYRQAGGAPAATDVLLAESSVAFDGASLIGLADLTAARNLTIGGVEISIH